MRTAVWLCTTLLCVSAFAEDRVMPEPRIESTRSVGLGTGARASAVSTQAQAENPANLGRGGLYHIEAFMSYQPQMKRVGAGAAVVDSMTSRLAAGLSARGLFGDNDTGENSGWEGRLGIGFPFADVFSVGLAGRYTNFTISDPKASPAADDNATSVGMSAATMTNVTGRTLKLNAFTMDASMTLRPIEELSISALGYNLIDTESLLAPLMVGGSLAIQPSAVLTIGGDLLVDMNTHKEFSGAKVQAGGGLEYLASGVAPLRAGFLYDQGRKQNSVTAGIGYVDASFGVQIGYRQSLSGVKESTVMAALQYFVQ